MAGNARETGRTVASRILAIFDAFDMQHPQLSLSEISRRAGLPLTTTHRLVTELTRWRGLERDENGNYFIGLRAWEVGLLSPLHTRLREVAQPFMQSLYEASRENVHLAVRDGLDAMYVEKLAGPRSVPIISRTGGRLPMHATGVGKALLAWESPELINTVLSRPLERPTRYTITAPGRLRRELEETRQRGYAVTREEMTLGSCSVAAPVLDRAGAPAAAVGLVVHSVHVEPEKLAPQIRMAADGIASRLEATRDDPYPGYVHDFAANHQRPSPGTGRAGRDR
ncbi:MAG: helix-turn-helix domain-containing protein [Propionibacteriales bacterium]|nr:helix-turn-helix domain-containing protein [Propionibacteriales bacterium]